MVSREVIFVFIHTAALWINGIQSSLVPIERANIVTNPGESPVKTTSSSSTKFSRPPKISRSSISNQGNFIEGEKILSDGLIGQAFVFNRTIPFLRTYWENTIYTTHQKIIHQIVAENLAIDWTGADVKVISYGLNYDKVTMRITSKRNKGLHYMIRLYGR